MQARLTIRRPGFSDLDVDQLVPISGPSPGSWKPASVDQVRAEIENTYGHPEFEVTIADGVITVTTPHKMATLEYAGTTTLNGIGLGLAALVAELRKP